MTCVEECFSKRAVRSGTLSTSLASLECQLSTARDSVKLRWPSSSVAAGYRSTPHGSLTSALQNWWGALTEPLHCRDNGFQRQHYSGPLFFANEEVSMSPVVRPAITAAQRPSQPTTGSKSRNTLSAESVIAIVIIEMA